MLSYRLITLTRSTIVVPRYSNDIWNAIIFEKLLCLPKQNLYIYCKCCLFLVLSVPLFHFISFSHPFKRTFPFFSVGLDSQSLLKGIFFLIRWLERFIKCVVYGYLFSTCVFWLPKRMAEPRAKRLSAAVRWLSMTDTGSPSSLIGSRPLLSFLPFASRSCELNRLC